MTFQGNFQQISDYARSLNRCCGKQAHLASITSSAENAFVAGVLAPFSIPPFFPGGQPTPAVPWIGLNNREGKAQYAWDGTNETVAKSGAYVNWCTTSCVFDQTPTADRTFCAFMSSTTGSWYSAGCGSFGKLFVLEYDCA
jgi:hypothetical protein